MPLTSVHHYLQKSLSSLECYRFFSDRHHNFQEYFFIHFLSGGAQGELRSLLGFDLVLLNLLFSFQFHSQVLSIKFTLVTHALKTFSLPTKQSIFQCIGIPNLGNIWIDKMFLHNLQQCRRLRASKIDTFPGMAGLVNIQTFPLCQALSLEFRMLWTWPRNHRWVRPSPCTWWWVVLQNLPW